MIDKQPVRKFLASLVHNAVQIGDDDSLLVARLIDSLKVAELIVFLEDHFQVSFDSDDLTPENFDTVNAIAALLARKTA